MTNPKWGLPWHGLWNDGNLALPNSTLKPYPQPTSSAGGALYLLSESFGRTIRVRRPEWTSPDNSAEDIAAGKSWRGEAIISGAIMQLGGQRLDGWIYFCEDGSRWLIQADQLTASTTTASMRLKTRPFGRVGAAVEPVEQTLSVNPGQSTPVINGLGAYYAGVSAVNDNPTEPNKGLRLWDVSSDGSRAVFQVFIARVQYAPSYNPQLPVGWLEVLVTGGDADTPPTAALTVLYTRAQTLATVTEESEFTEYSIQLISESVEVEDASPPSWVLEEYKDYPAKKFYISTITQRLIEIPGSLHPDSASGSFLRGGWAMEFGPRVVSVWYDEAGDPQAVTVSASLSYAAEADTASSSSGTRVLRTVDRLNNGERLVWSDVNTIGPSITDLSRTTVEALEIRLTGPGGEATKNATVNRANTLTVKWDSPSWSYTSAGAAVDLEFDGESYSASNAGGGAATNISQGVGNELTGFWGAAPSIMPPPVLGCWFDRPSWFLEPPSGWSAGDPITNLTPADWHNITLQPSYTWHAVHAFRRASITPTMQGWLSIGGANAGTGLAGVTVKHSAVLTPSGTDSRTWSCPYSASGGNGAWGLHGSRDPMTGECARFYPTQVCYV